MKANKAAYEEPRMELIQLCVREAISESGGENVYEGEIEGGDVF